MRNVALSMFAALLTATPAVAQEGAAPAASATAASASSAPLALKAGQVVRTADGRSLGRVDRVLSNGGQPVSVSVIYNQRFIHVPVATLSSAGKGLTTSLSHKEVTRLN